MIAQIDPGSPADLCGELRVTDRILQINGKEIAEGTEVRDASESTAVPTAVTTGVSEYRRSHRRDVTRSTAHVTGTRRL